MAQHQQNVREAARSMIRRYGHAALEQTDQRIGELGKLGEVEAVALWREIRTAVQDLTDGGEYRPDDG